MESKFYKYQVAPFFLGLLSLYIVLIVYFDNTNITTTNGLYKSMDTYGWEMGTKFAVDSGGLLYAFTMGMISKLIPDSLVNFYGNAIDFVAHRKLTWIHSVFGASSSAVVFTFAYHVTKDKLWAFGVALIHAFSFFILINSIISEDIIPGYFFFTLSVLFLYRALDNSEKVRLCLSLSTLSVVAMLLFHWTLLPPLAASYLVLVCFLSYHDRRYLRLFIEQLLLLIVVIFVFVILANFFAAGRYPKNLSVWGTLYPSKAGPSSWVGFGWNKVWQFYPGIGGYLVPQLLVSWAVTLVSISVLLVSFFKEEKLLTKSLALFGLSIFLFGQLQNLYGQAADPQFEIQPMFLVTISCISLYFIAPVKKYIRILLPILGLVIAGNNFIKLQPARFGDSILIQGFKEFRREFPKESTRIVHLAYEGWGTWLMLFDYHGDFKEYLKEVTCLNTPFHFTPGISAKQAADEIMAEIDQAFASGKRVIATTPWTFPDGVYDLLAQNVTREEATELRDILLKHYKVKAIHKVTWGEFAEIEKRGS